MFFFSTRFERDYTRTKSKEVEDSQEIRRLKTEKMVLRHRVDALEDVRKLLKLLYYGSAQTQEGTYVQLYPCFPELCKHGNICWKYYQ
jgi:hypothetical protein